MNASAAASLSVASRAKLEREMQLTTLVTSLLPVSRPMKFYKTRKRNATLALLNASVGMGIS